MRIKQFNLDFITFIIGLLMGSGVMLIIAVSPLIKITNKLKSDAINADVARYHPETGLFEFIQKMAKLSKTWRNSLDSGARVAIIRL